MGALLLGTAPATAGLFGVGGEFALGTTLATLGTAATIGQSAIGISQGLAEADAAEFNARAQLAAAQLGFEERALERAERRIRTIAEIRAANLGGGDRASVISQIREASSRELRIDRSRLSLASAILRSNRRTARRQRGGVIVGGIASALGQLGQLGIERR